MYTTIQIRPETREQLSKLKAGRETYDDLLNAFLELVPKGDDEGEYTDEFRLSILRGLLDIRRGRTHSLTDVKKDLGIK